jgi:hypothetical protein
MQRPVLLTSFIVVIVCQHEPRIVLNLLLSDSIIIGQAWIDQAVALADEQQCIGEERASRFELEKSFPRNECHRALNEEKSLFIEETAAT